MKKLAELILIKEAAFQTNEWSKHDFKYAISVIFDLINNNPVYLSDNGKKSDNILKTNDKIISELKKLCINPEVEEASDLKLKTNTNVDDFDNIFYKYSNIKSAWTKIFKGTYSKSVHSGSGGLEFENKLCKSLQDCFLNGKSDFEYGNKLYIKLLNKNPKTFNIINEKLKKDSTASIDDFIFVSGKGSTARNSNGQILNTKTFEVNIDKKLNIDSNSENKINNVLYQSGKIIADITITTEGKQFNKSDINNINPNDIYISCKDGFAQFSAISIQSAFYGENPRSLEKSDLINSFKNNETYEDFIKNKSDNVEAFNNLCKFMCIEPNVVYDYFKTPLKDRDPERVLKTNNSVDGNIIGTLIHLLIGGNYWYANSKSEPVFIDYDIDSSEFEFVPTGDCRLNPKQIVLIGELNNEKLKDHNAKIEIKFRSTDSGASYPYRLFVVPKDKNIIDLLFAK